MVTINGLNVDAEAIGNGMYEIICDKGDAAIVAFGMIPQWCIDMMRKPLREKIIAEAAKQVQCDVETITPYLDEKRIAKTLADIEHQIVLAIYAAAKNANAMVV